MRKLIVSNDEQAVKAMNYLGEVLGFDTKNLISLTVTFKANDFVKVQTEFAASVEHDD